MERLFTQPLIAVLLLELRRVLAKGSGCGLPSSIEGVSAVVLAT